MISNEQNNLLLEHMVELLELPDSAYQKATERYEDLGEWFGRDGASCAINKPHIFVQGSFRLGTAIKPLNDGEEYDLDLSCKLSSGITSDSHSQEDLKQIVGDELELYRKARNIMTPLSDKHRCWRLEYADELRFHMDIVPSIPQLAVKINDLKLLMEGKGMEINLASSVSELSVGITDNRLPSYPHKDPDWLISNPEGYAKWFEARMNTSTEDQILMERAQVDDVPTYKKKTPLQRTIQLLKRHRDQRFKEKPDSKPISIIITTIAGESYQAGKPLNETLNDVLNGLNRFVTSGSDFLPNPVNPEENFADRWGMPAYAHLKLRENFSLWVQEVTRDFSNLSNSTDFKFISKLSARNFSVQLNEDTINHLLAGAPVSPRPTPTIITEAKASPWLGK